MISRRVSDAPALLVSLQEFKAHAAIEDDEQDLIVAGLLRAAQDYVERHCSVALTAQTWELILDTPTDVPITLPVWPVTSITSISHEDGDSPAPEVDPLIYYLRHTKPARIHTRYDATWPSLRSQEAGMRIVYEAGYGEAGPGLDTLRVAVLFLAAHWFANREAVVVGASVVDLPFALKGLLDQNRII